MNTHINTPKLSIYHPNAKGTGAAIQFELKPAHANSFSVEDGALYCRIAPQITKGFDFENPIPVKFGFTDICKILQVLRGETESIDGKGLYFRTSKWHTRVMFRHVIDPASGYSMEFYRTHTADNEDGQDSSAHILFTSAEGLGLAEVFTASLKDIAFGTGFEATSIALARDEAMYEQASTIASETAKKEVKEYNNSYKSHCVSKAVAKVNALAELCNRLGKNNETLISRMLDIACGDREDLDDEFCSEYLKLGKEVLGTNHSVWKFVKYTI